MRDFGADTVWLNSPVSSLDLEPDNRLQLDTTTDQGTGEMMKAKALYTRSDGVTVYGGIAKFNTPNFQFSISAPPRAGALPSAKLQMSAAAFSPDGDNLSLHNADTLHDAMRGVEDALSSIGVHWQLSAAKVAKVAITRQFIVDEPIPHHLRVLAACGTSRRAETRDYGDTGVTVGNGQRTTTGYGKRDEMEFHGKDFTRCHERLIRMEATLGTTQAVRAALNIFTLPELCQNFHLLPEAYFKEWQREVFKTRNEPIERPIFDWDSILDEAAAAARPRYALAGVWALAIVSDMGLRRAETEITKRFSGRENRDKRAMLLRDLVDANTQIEMQKITPHGSPYRKLYLELQSKTLAPILLAA